MTANDLYNMKPETVTRELYYLKGCYYDHVPEVGLEHEWMNEESSRIQLKILKDFSFDGRRVWRLITVWFDSEPVMVIQNAGREGDDFAHRYVTDEARLLEMAAHIRTLVPVKVVDAEECMLSPHKDMTELTEFYGHKLGGYFEVYQH